MNFIKFKCARTELFLFALVLSAAFVTSQSQAQDAFDVLPCDTTLAAEKRATVKGLAVKAVSDKLQLAGVTDVLAQTRIIQNVGNLVLDLSLLKANGIGKALQRSKPMSDEELRKLLRQSVAAPIAPTQVAPQPPLFAIDKLHPATSTALRDAASFIGATHLTRAQHTQVQTLDLRNKNLIDWTFPLGSLAGTTVVSNILRQGSEKRMLLDARGLIATRDEGWRARDSIRMDLSRLLVGGGSCSACNTGEPLQGEGTARANAQKAPPKFKPRTWLQPTGDTPATEADKSCKEAFNEFAAGSKASQIIDQNRGSKPVDSIESYVLWAQGATNDQLKSYPRLLNLASDFVAKCQPSVARLEPPNENDVTRFVGAIGAPISALEVVMEASSSSGQSEPSLRTCTGTLISANTVLTARHCFMSRKGDRPDEMFKDDVIKRHWFELDSGEPFRYQVCGIKQSGVSSMPKDYRPANDWIELTIAEPKGNRTLHYKAELTDVRMLDKLRLPGVNILLPQSVDFPPLTTTEVTGCAVLAITNSCIFHNCQTLPAMSGAPVFLQPEIPKGNLKLVGIHLGRRSGTIIENTKETFCDDASPPQPAMYVKDLRNMAVRADVFINAVVPK